jgi:signal transduction histidine kinase
MKPGFSWRNSDLRTKLIVTYALLILVGFGVLAWLAGGQISRAAQEDFIAAQQAQSELLARSTAATLEDFLHGEIPLSDVQVRLRLLAGQLQLPLVLLDPRGRVVIDSSDQTPQGEVLQTPEIMAALANGAAPAIRSGPHGEPTLFTAAPIVDDGRVLGVIQMAQPMSTLYAPVQRRWEALAVGVSLLALLAVAAGSLMAASLTRPLAAMRDAAMRVAAGDFSRRLPAGRQDEIGQVATAFNHMADQVQTMLDEQRAFAANASHELRTPLTTIRLRSEALRNGILFREAQHSEAIQDVAHHSEVIQDVVHHSGGIQNLADHGGESHNQSLDDALARQYIVEIDEEAARMGSLVEDLILLARLDAGRGAAGDSQIDMARLARGLLREFEASPEAQQITFTLDAPADLPVITASLNHLRVLLRNLLSNAVAYTPPGGAITCALQANNAWLTLTVADSGQGIAPEDLPHVTERFFRADKAHTRAIKGSGLGLTLVQSIVNCYQGQLEISSPGIGQGTTVRVRLPLQLQSLSRS